MNRRPRRPGRHVGPIAVRAFVPPTRPRLTRDRPDPPRLVLVLDTETTTDEAQRLLFGSYRLHRADGKLLQEGLIAADDLAPADRMVLERYVADHDDDRGGQLRLWSRAEFVEHVLWKIGYEARALVVGFNLPFDLSRLATGWVRSRAGGFSLSLWEWIDETGHTRSHQFRPNITIKALGSKRQFIGFTTPGRLDPANRVGKFGYRGRFLDLHTLSYVLTDRSLSLDGAAGEFGLLGRKAHAERHGVVTEAYVDYNRQDVRLTFELYRALMSEWERHPIDLAPEQAFSPAAVGKAYLRKLGVRPSATGFGGRTCRDAPPASRAGRGPHRLGCRRLPFRVRGRPEVINVGSRVRGSPDSRYRPVCSCGTLLGVD